MRFEHVKIQQASASPNFSPNSTHNVLLFLSFQKEIRCQFQPKFAGWYRDLKSIWVPPCVIKLSSWVEEKDPNYWPSGQRAAMWADLLLDSRGLVWRWETLQIHHLKEQHPPTLLSTGKSNPARKSQTPRFHKFCCSYTYLLRPGNLQQ